MPFVVSSAADLDRVVCVAPALFWISIVPGRVMFALFACRVVSSSLACILRRVGSAILLAQTG